MSVLSTFLVFVVIPLAAILLIGGLAYAGASGGRTNRRYRPGRPYDFQPIWFLAAPERIGTPVAAPLLHGQVHGELEQGDRIEPGVIEDSAGARVLPGPTGGASDRW